MPTTDNANDEYVLTMIQPDAAGRSFNVSGAPGCEGLSENDERGAVFQFRRGVPQRVPEPVFKYLKDRKEKTVRGSIVPVFQVGLPDQAEVAELPAGEQFEAVRERLTDQDERLDGIDGRLDQIIGLLQEGAPKRAAAKKPKKKRGRPRKKAIAAKAQAEAPVVDESTVPTGEPESITAKETVTGASGSAA